MSEYSIERAKSGRSKCKKCKVQIEKGELRLGTTVPAKDGGDYGMTSWTHIACFNLPRKFKEEGVEEFVNTSLIDNTGDGELERIKDQVIADITSKKPKGAAAKDEADLSPVEKIQAHLKRSRDGEEGAPAAKKMKLSPKEEAMLDVYVQYEKMKADELKDILEWNRQQKSGNKNLLLTRIIDGQMNGRLARCPVCTRGKLQIENETSTTAICKGYWDEDLAGRIPCRYSTPLEEVERLHPWFTEKPTEEEEAELDRIDEAAKGGVAPSAEVDDATASLVDKANKLEWSLDNKKGMQAAANKLLEILTDAKVDVPSDEKDAKMKVGAVLVSNRTLSPGEIIQMLVEQFGFAEQKQEAKEKKKAATEKACKCPDNAHIVEVMHELSQLYFKEGNRNAGGTYVKVANAIAQLDFAITEENAKGLGKGKTKVEGIGKGSAEKIYEFITTGEMQKLVEKRAAVA